MQIVLARTPSRNILVDIDNRIRWVFEYETRSEAGISKSIRVEVEKRIDDV